MGRTSVAKVAVSLAIVVLVCGCATGPKGPTDEEMIMAQLDTLKAAVLAHDIEKTMATLSEDFYHPEVGDKEAMSDIFQMGIDGGYIDDTAEGDFSRTEVTVEEDTATASPVVGSSSLGSLTVEVTFKKESGSWLITGGDAVY